TACCRQAARTRRARRWEGRGEGSLLASVRRWGRPGAGCATAAAFRVERGQRQVGQNACSRRRLVEDHLVGALEDVFHRLDVEPPRRHVLGRLVGLVDREEAAGVALGGLDDLLAIGLGLLLDLRRIAIGLGHDAVEIFARLDNLAVALGLGGLHVGERGDHVLRRQIDTTQIDAGDLDAAVIAVEDLLQQILRLLHHRILAADDGADRLGAADHFAHGAFGHRLHRLRRIADVEQVFGRILDLPLHGEIDVEQVLVASQHARFCRLLVQTAPRTFARRAADLDDVGARHLGRQRVLDRYRPVIVEPGRGLAVVGAEAQDDAFLVRLHDIEAADAPDDDNRDEHEQDARPAAPAAGQQPAHAILAAPEDLLEIGRFRAAAAATPWALAAAPRAAATTAAAALVPRHLPCALLRGPHCLCKPPAFSLYVSDPHDTTGGRRTLPDRRAQLGCQ